ncbi:MAG: helix-turn-helix domain-containing protein [Desulfobulbaceae bacterium]|nr:helix-turn-helix domain-containing protein [Desulfobulbaceae bacterium]
METSTTSPIACVLIDGKKIRRIRQERGFTQLYVATCLTVTTDTISRWENNRSPSIKQENAEKLAEVLDVDLSEIMQQSEPRQEPAADPVGGLDEHREEAEPPVGIKKVRLVIPILIVLAAIWLGYRYASDRVAVPLPTIAAERFLPAHTSPHVPFPVFIRVHHAENTQVSFILRESFPDSILVKQGIPPFTTLNTAEGKWIGITGDQDLLFGYLSQPDRNVVLGQELVFTGHVLVEEHRFPVNGATTTVMENYHWADRNTDYVIDDNEILAIYSFFELFKRMGIDIDEIQRIWAGNGYRWDEAGARFIVVSNETSQQE